MVVIPPIGLIAERRVIAHLRDYGAVTAEKPMGYAPGRYSHARALRRLRDADVIKGDGQSLWLDEPAWNARQRQRRKRALAVAAVAVISAGLAGLTTLRG